jgi:hypothetical protein
MPDMVRGPKGFTTEMAHSKQWWRFECLWNRQGWELSWGCDADDEGNYRVYRPLIRLRDGRLQVGLNRVRRST